MNSYVRSGGLLIPGRRYVRSGGVLVEGRPVPYVATLLSADVYPSPPWSAFLAASEPVAKFPSGANRNRLYSPAGTSGVHVFLRNWPVTGGVTYKMSLLAQADTVDSVETQYFNGGTYLNYGYFRLATGVPDLPATMTLVSPGVYRCEQNITAPSGATQIETRILIPNGAYVNDYVASNESVFLGEMTFNPT